MAEYLEGNLGIVTKFRFSNWAKFERINSVLSGIIRKPIHKTLRLNTIFDKIIADFFTFYRVLYQE